MDAKNSIRTQAPHKGLHKGAKKSRMWRSIGIASDIAL